MLKHLGDITKLDGATIEPVWCVTGGSPCQDLSIAGKRAGLAGARSGLFMEQIRVIKEMREHDKQLGWAGELIRPRYMVWENVPGALSSNKGRDFAAVLEETIRIVEPEAPSVEVPEKGWPTWGGYRDVHGAGTAVWASEIEEFPIAVTKKRFGSGNMIRYTLNIEPPVEPPAYTCPICPVCGEEADTLYKDRQGNVIGCTACITEVDAWTL